MSSILDRVRRVSRGSNGEAGQALVIGVLAAFLLILVSGYAIDYAAAAAKREQVQNAVDAASLAAANCLATGAPGSTCTSQTDTTDAVGVATKIAAANGVTIQPSQVSINTSSDKVTIAGSGSLAGTMPFGVNSQTRVETASSTASYQAAEPCANGDVGTGNCIAVFAGGTSCPAATNWLLWTTQNFGTGIETNATLGVTFDGALVSNSDVSLSVANGDTSSGGEFYGSGSNCWGTTPNWLQRLFGVTTGEVKALPAYQNYPQTWSVGANASGVTTLTSSMTGQPITCTYTVTNGAVTPAIPTSSGFSASVSGYNLTLTALRTFNNPQIPTGVYCDPNGSITIAGAGLTGTIGGNVSFYANAISGFALNMNLSPCTSIAAGCNSTNALLMYQTGTSQLSIGSAASALSGTIYAPNATLAVGGLASSYGFLEAQTVNITAVLALFGNGPEVSSLGTTVNVDSLSN